MNIGGKEFAPEVVQQMIDAGILGTGAKHDTSSATPNAAPLHGPFPGAPTQFGILSQSGVRPGIFNGTAQPRGISQIIPAFKSVILNETIQVLTGVTAGSGNNNTSACADAPVAGDLKTMSYTNTYGIVHIGTKIDDVTQIGLRRDRTDVDRDVLNNAMQTNPFLPRVPGIDGEGIAQSRLRAAIYTLGTELGRNMGPVQYVGVAGTENNTYRGIARQWNGLDRWIRSGYVDSVTGLAAPRADSLVYSFNGVITGTGTGAFTSGRTIVQAITELIFSMQDMDSQLGLGEVNRALVMRPDAFLALVDQWACTYAVAYCGDGTAGQPVTRDAEATRRRRDEMWNGRYLLVNGEQFPVIFDDSIPREVLANNNYKSDIYLVALSWNGQPMLFAEYFPMDNSEAEQFLTGMGIQEATSTTVNDGLYRVFKRQTKGCIQYDFFARLRLTVLAPFMFGRIDDLFYNSYYRQTDSTPGASYHLNGGSTYRL